MTTPQTDPPTGEAAAPAARVTVRCAFCRKWNRIDPARAADRPKCGHCAKPILLDRPLSLDDDSFARTIEASSVPVVVDFYADWCGPCKMMAPHVDELAKRYEGRALVAKLDTDHAQVTAQRFQIRGIPTTIVFRNGRAVAQQTGAMRLPELESLLARASA
ncbi:MAG: thioredoxin [Gemmatirosa sp.]|nr:thioredoxin [Gemmatirosa sp.]